jgi:small subunit ribosomal protein S30
VHLLATTFDSNWTCSANFGCFYIFLRRVLARIFGARLISNFRKSEKMISRVIFCKHNKIQLLRYLSTAVQHEPAAAAVEYPPIFEVSPEARAIRKKLDWHDKIKRCPTIEEKIMEINMPRYYGYRCHMLDGTRYPYDTTDFIKYITKTEFQELSQKIADESEAKKIEGFLDLIKADIQDAIEFEIDAHR